MNTYEVDVIIANDTEIVWDSIELEYALLQGYVISDKNVLQMVHLNQQQSCCNGDVANDFKIKMLTY